MSRRTNRSSGSNSRLSAGILAVFGLLVCLGLNWSAHSLVFEDSQSDESRSSAALENPLAGSTGTTKVPSSADNIPNEPDSPADEGHSQFTHRDMDAGGTWSSRVEPLKNTRRESRSRGEDVGSKQSQDKHTRSSASQSDASAAAFKDNSRADSQNSETATEVVLFGKVVDQRGVAVKDSLVAHAYGVETLEGARAWFARTNEFGRFRIVPRESTGNVLISAMKEGHRSEGTRSFVLKGESIDLGTLTLISSQTVSGTVLEEGAPLDSVSLNLQKREGSWFHSVKSSTTNALGQFSFADLPQGEYRILAERHGYSALYSQNISPPQEITINLTPSATISGRVTSSDTGEPLAGASVEVYHYSEPRNEFRSTATTREDGSFTCECLADTTTNRLRISKLGYHTYTQEGVSANTEGISVSLPKNGNSVITGTLRLDTGEAISSAKIEVLSIGTGGHFRSQTFLWSATQEPRFEMDFNAKGVASLLLRISSNEFVKHEQQIVIEPGGQLDVGLITLSKGLTLSGTVYDDSSDSLKPVDGAIISFSALSGTWSVTTNESGRFSISGIVWSARDEDRLANWRSSDVQPSEAVGLSASKHGYQSSSEHGWKVNPTKTEAANVVLRKAGKTLSGFVYSAIGDQPGIEGAMVYLKSDPSIRTTTGPQGYYELSHVRIEGQVFVASAPGFLDDEMKNEDNDSDIVFRLTPGSAIVGQVTRADNGSPVPAGAPLEIWEGGRVVANVTTDAEGRYTSPTLEPGTYWVGSSTYRLAPRKAVIPEDGQATLDLQVRATITLSGRILRADGKPHANAGVYVYRTLNSGVFDTIYTDGAGRYELKHAWPGQFTFAILKSQADQAAQFFVDVTVTSGNDSQVYDVTLPASEAVIDGVVRYPDGTPAAGARVAITNQRVQLARGVLAGYVLTDAEGRYRATRLEENTPMLARVGGYADGAETGLGFSAIVTTGRSGSVTVADIVVARKGFRINLGHRRADGGPMNGVDLSGILIDGSGRRVGNYFGGVLFDLIPGTYQYRAYSSGFFTQPITITVTVNGDVKASGPLIFQLDPDFG